MISRFGLMLKTKYTAALILAIAIPFWGCNYSDGLDSAEETKFFVEGEIVSEGESEESEYQEQRDTKEWQQAFTAIIADKPGDDDIVAIVGKNGEHVITRGDLRVMAEANVLHQSGVSVDEMLDKVIVSQVDSALLHAKAIRLGHEPSDEELQAYMKPHRDACESPQGSMCRKMILEQGYSDEEDYWKDAAASYKRGMALINIRQAHLDSKFPNGATGEQEDKELAAYEKSLRQSVDIEWKDDNLKARYELALQKAKSGNMEDE